MLAHMETLAAGLHGLGRADEEARVREAMEQARLEPDKAASLLHDVAAGLMAQVPAYSRRAQVS